MTNEKFTQLVREYADTVFRVALNMVKSPSAADDVCQEVFMRLWRSGKDFDSYEHAKHWLIRVAINESKRSLASVWNRYDDIDSCADRFTFRSPEQSELFRLVSELPAKYSVTIYLYYYEGYRTAEIAAMTRVPEATVRTRLRRARTMLKNIITEAEN